MPKFFVGAEGKMEMTRCRAGYKIIGLPIAGFINASWRYQIYCCLQIGEELAGANAVWSRSIPMQFVGTGGYASGPMLITANSKGVPTLLQNKILTRASPTKQLASKARRFAWLTMEWKIFSSAKISFTLAIQYEKDIVAGQREKALEMYGLRVVKTLFVLGGSLGARTLNESILPD